MTAHPDPTLAEAIRQYGDQLYSVCENVRGFENYLTAAGSLTREQLYEGMNPEAFQDDNAWYNYRQYCQLMTNVVRHQKHLHTHYEYATIGSHVLSTQRSFWYRYLALLPLQTVFHEATRVSNRVQNAYRIAVHELSAGHVGFTIQDSEAFRQISFGSECRYMNGVLGGMVTLNGVNHYTMHHLVCGKSLRHLLVRQYGLEPERVRTTAGGILLDGTQVTEAITREQLYERVPGLPDLHIDKPLQQVVDDVAVHGLTILRKGEIYDAPCCYVSLNYEPVQVWSRVKNFLFSRERQLVTTVQELGRQIQFAKEKLFEAQAALRDSQRKSSILRVYVRPSLVELVDEGQNPLHLEPAEVDVAILFHDIIGFTTLSQQLSPKQVVDLLNFHFDNVCQTVYRHDGEVDKIMGDCVLGLFTDADKAVAAAMELECTQQEHRQRILRDYGVQLRAGTGIHYGRVILSNVGGSKKLDYTIIGDPVNCASRIQQLTRKYGTWMLVSDDLKQAMSKQLQMAKVGEETLRGRNTPTALWSLLSPSSTDRAEPDRVPEEHRAVR